jgi:hypothetical protein
MKIIPVTEAIAKLKDHRKNGNGRVFGCTVISRTTNTLKTMNCRFGVDKTTGAGRTYNPESKGLITVFEQNRQGYRNINLSGLRSLTIDGEVYQIV